MAGNSDEREELDESFLIKEKELILDEYSTKCRKPNLKQIVFEGPSTNVQIHISRQFSYSYVYSIDMSDTGDQTNENLIWCAKTGDLATLKTLLNKVPGKAYLIDVFNLSSLCIQNPKKIEELLNGRLLSHYAADAGQVDVLKELVHNGAKVNVRVAHAKVPSCVYLFFQAKDRYGITPLLAAIYEDHVDCVKYLLEQVSLSKQIDSDVDANINNHRSTHSASG